MRPLTSELATWLTTSDAQSAIDHAMTLPLDERQTLATLTMLQKEYTQERAAALLDQARLRLRARPKFGKAAAQMLFTDEALQQSSGTSIANYRARRYAPFGGVADLGCGIGGDAIALSHVTPHLWALDIDPIRLILAHYNLNRVGGITTTHMIEADWTTYPFPSDLSAAFADPARRIEERRVYSLYEMVPPIGAVLATQKTVPHMGVKVMPGVADEELPDASEAEWISEGGVCKEGVLWFGDLRHGAERTATIVDGNRTFILTSGDPAPPLAVTPPRAYLYEPDPAVIRATLVAQAALPMGASQIDPQIAYLTGDMPALTPFLRGWQVLLHAPFNLKTLNRMIRELGANVIAVKKRGSPIEPEPFRKRLKSDPKGRPVTVFLTRHLNEPYMIVCGEEIRE
jgi:SAM-dependent methyltransferase